MELNPWVRILLSFLFQYQLFLRPPTCSGQLSGNDNNNHRLMLMVMDDGQQQLQQPLPPETVHRQESTRSATSSASAAVQNKDLVLEKLMQVFGIRPPLQPPTQLATQLQSQNNNNNSPQRHIHNRYHHRRHFHHRHPILPPQYMLDLYSSTADTSGITKMANPYDANVIRSFPDRDMHHPMHFLFDVSSVDSAKERILQAEFHVFKMPPGHSGRSAAAAAATGDSAHSTKPSGTEDVRSHLLEMRVYQVKNVSHMNTETGNRLLDARRVSAFSVGWEVFRVKNAVADWLTNHSTNLGLLVTLRSMKGDPLAHSNVLQIAKRRHQGNKQPILVLFSDDGRPKQTKAFPTPDELAEWNLSQSKLTKLDVSPEADPSEKIIESPAPTSPSVDSKNTTQWPISPEEEGEVFGSGNRKRRSEKKLMDVENEYDEEELDKHPNKEDEQNGDVFSSSSELPVYTGLPLLHQFHRPTDCHRQELYVDFEKIGWSSWIISPKGYNAFYCTGQCSFPLGQNQRPTNHATVQSIVHELGLHEGLQMPCCVPNKLFSISLLYFEGDGNVVLKQYEDMVAASCGCN